MNVRGAALAARLDALAATGVKVTRVNVLWDQVAPRRPADAREPGRPGLRLEPLRRDRPRPPGARDHGDPRLLPDARAGRRASGTPESPRRAPPTAPASPGRSRAATPASFPDPLGGVLPRMGRIEVWNEPNLPGFWMPQCRRGAGGRARLVSPGAYAALLAASYREIHAANPSAQVIGGVAGPAGRSPTSCPTDGRAAVGSLDWARLVADEGPPIDAWSMHIYPIGGPLQAFFVPSWSTLPRVARQVDRLRAGAPIHVTETGYHTSYNRFHQYFVSEAQQAAWVDETMTAAAAQPRVSVVTWFNFQDNPRWTGGLLRSTARASRRTTGSPRRPRRTGPPRDGRRERGPPRRGPGLLRQPGRPPRRRGEPQLAPPEPHGAQPRDHRPLRARPERPGAGRGLRHRVPARAARRARVPRHRRSTCRRSRWSTPTGASPRSAPPTA